MTPRRREYQSCAHKLRRRRVNGSNHSSFPILHSEPDLSGAGHRIEIHVQHHSVLQHLLVNIWLENLVHLLAVVSQHFAE